MKMPRSHFENDNVQFVQELAEVDGPFESPININFRDMTKLELPPLVWNRGDTIPKKMKITNTGHTVIISGKWKSERPYLTGGPLTGKYVFSQIHFHWGQDYTRGSEHQVCGEGYPLEMHVAHFKTEYLTQESALREKDGMVVVVYLFKLQEEPNDSLKKIINLLPCVKHASTSHAIDPQSILSLCNPFTEDYFMYWGSVVTSTCAHILMWVICREPFGISRDQVDEFRKLMDSSQQPISRNSRDIQPLHKRNVFHVNASNFLDEPLLPVKKTVGCKCKKSEDNVSFQLSTDCTCQYSSHIQEDVEGSIIEYLPRSDCISTEGMPASNDKASLFSDCFPNQNVVVQTATVHSLSIVLKRFDSDPVDHSSPESLQPIKSQNDSRKLTSQSCCFFSTSDIPDIKAENRKIRDRKRPFNSLRAFSQIISSLEALKTHTFKKLKEIESINQEIKGMKPIFPDAEDKQWLRKIEKMMSKKKEFTINTSHGYLKELKKLAKECNFDKFFDSKTLHETENGEKMTWPPGNETANGKAQTNLKKDETPAQRTSNGKIIIPEKAQKLIQSFFEDIKDTDDMEETVKSDQNPINISGAQAGETNSISNGGKGYITQNMFKLGNLGDRFFTEVTSEDIDMNKEQWEAEKTTEKLQVLKELDELKNATWSKESQKITTSEDPEPEKVLEEPKRDPVIPLHRASIPIAISKGTVTHSETLEDFYQELHVTEGERRIPSSESLPDKRHLYRHKRSDRPTSRKTYEKICQKKLINRRNREFLSVADERLMRASEGKPVLQEIRISIPNLSTDSIDTHSMIIAKFRKKPSSKDFWPFNKSSMSRFAEISPKRYRKICCKKIEGFYIEKKNVKNKKRKRQKRRTWHTISSTKDWKALILNSKMKRAKFKLRLESTSNSTTTTTTTTTTTEFDLEKPISPERKKLRLENIKIRPGKTIFFSDDEAPEVETKRLPRNDLSARYEIKLSAPEKETVGGRTPSDGCSSRERRRGVMPCDPYKTPTSDRSIKTVRERREGIPSEVFKAAPMREILEVEDQVWSKPVPKNKSVSNVIVTPRRSTEFSQRLHMEYVDGTRNASRENSGLRSNKQSKENYQVHSVKNLYRGISNETYRKSDMEHDHEEKVLIESKDEVDSLSSSKLKYNIGFLTTSSQVDDELLPKDPNQEGANKNVFLKRCDAEKYLFLEKVPQEVSLSFKDDNDLFSEILHQTDSNKSFGTSKGDAETTNMGNMDLQTSVTYTTLRKNAASRPHSAETLSYLMKTIKRKYKKRPHCCKRNSIHYIRKNSSKKFEEVLFRKASQENEKVTLKDSHSLMLKDTSQEEISVPEPPEKEEKSESFENETNTKTSKFPTEAKKDKIQRPVTSVKKPAAGNAKPATAIARPILAIPKPVATAQKQPTPAVKKPVSNFIKINKELAGKYKRRMVTSGRNAEKPETPTKTKLPTPQAPKLPQRKRGKITVRKPDFLVHSTPQTPLPTKSKAYRQKTSPRGQKVKSPMVKPVKSLGCIKFDRISRSQTFAFRTPLFYSE